MNIRDTRITSFLERVQSALDDGLVLKKIGLTESGSYTATLSPAKPVKERIVRKTVKQKIVKVKTLKPDPLEWTRTPHLVPKAEALSPTRSYAYYYESKDGRFFPVIWLPRRPLRRHYTRRMYTGPDNGGMWFEKTKHNTKGKFDMAEYGKSWRLWADWPSKAERKRALWMGDLENHPV